MTIETMPLAEMKQYLGTDERPADFDSFWNDQLEALSKLKIAYELKKARFQADNVECNDLYYTSFDGSRIHCKLVKPTTEEKLPVLFCFHGYKVSSMDWWDKVFWANQGFCVVAMDVRGQGGTSQDLTSGFGNTSIGHLITGIEGDNIEDMTYLKVFKDIICLVDLVRSFDFVDKDDLAVHGLSQGGALSLVTAGLFKEVRKAAVLYPFLSDFRRVYDMDVRNTAYEEIFYMFRFNDPLHEEEAEYFRKLAYIDVKNFAPRIEGEVIMASGLRDEACPVSTQFAVFNNLKCKKKHYVYPDFGHEDYMPGFIDECYLFLKR